MGGFFNTFKTVQYTENRVECKNNQNVRCKMNAVYGNNGLIAIYLGNNLIGTVTDPAPGEHIGNTKWVVPEEYDHKYESASFFTREDALLNLRAYTDLVEI